MWKNVWLISYIVHQDKWEAAHQPLTFPLLPFPCKYLGLPLVLQKPTIAQLQPLVDKVVDKLPDGEHLCSVMVVI